MHRPRLLFCHSLHSSPLKISDAANASVLSVGASPVPTANSTASNQVPLGLGSTCFGVRDYSLQVPRFDSFRIRQSTPAKVLSGETGLGVGPEGASVPWGPKHTVQGTGCLSPPPCSNQHSHSPILTADGNFYKTSPVMKLAKTNHLVARVPKVAKAALSPPRMPPESQTITSPSPERAASPQFNRGPPFSPTFP